MKLGLISDAHGNSAGFDAAVAALRGAGAQQLLFAGDAVGYYPYVNEVIEGCRAIGVIAVRGNHDRLLIEPSDDARAVWSRYALDIADRVLRRENRAWLAALPAQWRVTIGGRRILLCHGSPWSDEEYVYPDASLEPLLACCADIVILGHTHIPLVARVGEVLVVNPGSCGQPRDYHPGASCALLDTDTCQASILHVEYDIEAFVRQLTRASVPDSFTRILTRTRSPAQ